MTDPRACDGRFSGLPFLGGFDKNGWWVLHVTLMKNTTPPPSDPAGLKAVASAAAAASANTLPEWVSPRRFTVSDPSDIEPLAQFLAQDLVSLTEAPGLVRAVEVKPEVRMNLRALDAMVAEHNGRLAYVAECSGFAHVRLMGITRGNGLAYPMFTSEGAVAGALKDMDDPVLTIHPHRVIPPIMQAVDHSRAECPPVVIGPPPPLDVIASMTSFTDILPVLLHGRPVRREYWPEGDFVFRQNTTQVSSRLFPNMTSLPDTVKDILLQSVDTLEYTAQFAYVSRTVDGPALVTGWSPSGADLTAIDWKQVHAADPE